jgi:hypothetical protein
MSIVHLSKAVESVLYRLAAVHSPVQAKEYD